MEVLIMNGDARYIPLADESVHCVVTSPPYWSLRDYGTARWEGGDAKCDHNPQRPDGGERSNRTVPLGRGGMYKDTCRKCGAQRMDNQLGLERTPEEYVANLVAVFREVRRVLHPSGTVWLNLGDSYAGSNCGSNDYRPDGSSISASSKKYKGQKPGQPLGLKPKDLVGIPWRVAFALQADGWWLRSDIIWAKPNPMPESVKDRPTKGHEYIFLLTKNKKYFYDAEAIKEPQAASSIKRAFANNNVDQRKDANQDVYTISGRSQEKALEKVRKSIERGEVPMRNKRSVWTFPTKSYKGAHFATYPPDLVRPCVLAGTSERGVCPQCGNPWERVVEVVNKGYAKHDGSSRAVAMGHTPTVPSSRGSIVSDNIQTIGWQPTCKCNAGEPVPANVLDIFVGSGTTLLVSRELGRNGVGIDLSYDYLSNQVRQRLG